MDDVHMFDMTVTVPVSEIAALKRRVRFLEAAVIQMLRHGSRVKEWFSAAELAEFRLAGLPSTAAGVARIAREQAWTTDCSPSRGGHRHLYHFSSLPRRAFEDLIDRIIRVLPPADAPEGDAPRVPRGPEPTIRRHDGVTAPSWVLPLMRIIRRVGSVETALRALPAALPAGSPCPTENEAVAVLTGLGLLVNER